MGSQPKASFEEIPPAKLSLQRRLYSIIYAQISSTSNITGTSKMSFDILKEEYPPLLEQINEIANVKLPEIRQIMNDLGAAYTPGRIPKLE